MSWLATDQEAIRKCLVLPATVPCLDAISRSMNELEQWHPSGVLSARALLDAVALIDQQLISGSLDMEQAIAKRSTSGPISTSVAATGDAPLQKADVIAYDTSLLREEIETTYANPTSISSNLITQRNRYATQLLLLLPHLKSWVDLTQGHSNRNFVSVVRG
jgi:hypothetical protein